MRNATRFLLGVYLDTRLVAVTVLWFIQNINKKILQYQHVNKKTRQNSMLDLTISTTKNLVNNVNISP